MTRPYTGGCACGAIRYRIDAAPIGMNDCQCRQCQQESGTGHGSHLTFPRNAVEVTGEASRWEATGDGGTVKSRAFCPTCGAPVYMTFPAMPDYFVVKASSLDDPTRYRPQLVSWHSTAQPWDRIDPALPTFDRMPPPPE
jgi:hypothetical protein